MEPHNFKRRLSNLQRLMYNNETQERINYLIK